MAAEGVVSILSFTVQAVQHVDSFESKVTGSMSSGSSGSSSASFEAETVVECVVTLEENQDVEMKIVETLTTLDGTAMSSNKEREDYERLIIGSGVGGGSGGSGGSGSEEEYATTNIKITVMPTVERIEKKKKQIVQDILHSQQQ